MEVGTKSPADRLRIDGIPGAGVADLLAVALAREERDVERAHEAAGRLLKSYGVKGLDKMGLEELRDACGMEPFEYLRFLAALELGSRIQQAGAGQGRDLIREPKHAYPVFKDLQGCGEERFQALYLDSKGGILHRSQVHKGTINMSVVGMREVFREAIRWGAASLIVAHNHPSGDPTPSPEDLDVTRKLRETGELLDITLLDHLIIGREGFISLKELGYL